jgi:hypothetical protein
VAKITSAGRTAAGRAKSFAGSVAGTREATRWAMIRSGCETRMVARIASRYCAISSAVLMRRAGVALEHRVEQLVEARRLGASQRGDGVVEDRVQRGRVVVAGEELLPRHGLPQHHARATRGPSAGRSAAPESARAHVRDLALHLPGAREAGLGGALGDAEIEQLHLRRRG